MEDPELSPDKVGSSSRPALVAGGLMVLAGLTTVVMFLVLVGRFPPGDVLWAPALEIAIGGCLILVRNRMVVWVCLLGMIGMIGLHAYRLKRIGDMEQLRARVQGRQAYADPDPETRRLVSRMSRIQDGRKLSNWMALGLGVIGLSVVFATRRGRELLSEQKP